MSPNGEMPQETGFVGGCYQGSRCLSHGQAAALPSLQSPFVHTAADQAFLREAIAEARTGLAEGEVPIGSVAVRAGAIVARGHNRRNALNDLTCHAEMACLRALGLPDTPNLDLSDLTLYSTLEPCAMCSGAILHYRIGRVVFGEYDLILGACGTALDILTNPAILAPRPDDPDTIQRLPEVTGGVLRADCRAPLLEYFERELGHPARRWRDILLPPDDFAG